MVYRKRTYKDVTDTQILNIWNELLAEAKTLYPQYFEKCEPELYQDDSYRHLGLCTQSFYNGNERNVDKIRAEKCIILVSSKLGQDYYQIRRTLCHELGHFVSPRENHSHLWKIRADKIGKPWNLKATRTTDNATFTEAADKARKELEKRSEYKYRLYCPNCDAEWKYKSKCKSVQNPSRYRCGKCKTTLKAEAI